MTKQLTRPLIAVPTYNESGNIELLVQQIREHAPEASILFIDDNSTDGTRAQIKAQQQRWPNHIQLLERPKKMGLGTAYLAAFEWALSRDYDAVIEMDADLSHDPRYLRQMIEHLASIPVVIGSRYIKDGGTVNWSPARKLLSRFGSAYSRLVLSLKIHDLTGGFNGWRREVLENICVSSVGSEGYIFQVELKYRAALAGYPMVEFPIIFRDRTVGKSKMSSKIVLEAVWQVWSLAGSKRLIQREFANFASKKVATTL